MESSLKAHNQGSKSERDKKRKLLKQLLLEREPYETDIAVIGMNGKYPDSANLEEFWSNLNAGKNCIREVPKERWDWREHYDPSRKDKQKSYTKWGGFIEDIDKFDPLFFSISPFEAAGMDPNERLFLETVWSTLEDAGYTGKELAAANHKVGVFVGNNNSSYEWLSGEASARGIFTQAHSAYWSIANRVSYFFNFQGPSLALDTACSSSLTAIHLACESLKRKECKLAIAGGVNLILHPVHIARLCYWNMVTADDKCKSFGEGADGFVDGEGVGAVLLKPLADAVKDGDRIYGVIKGSAINSGGRTNGYTVPNPNAQAEVILDVLNKTGIDPRTISYIETHGTGTSMGDPIEVAGLSKAFNQYTRDKHFCPIGSVKSSIGHLESAAGIASFTKVMLQLKHKQLVPSIHCETYNPAIDFTETPFYVQRDSTAWEQPYIDGPDGRKSYPRRAGISSFGAGGTNAHLIVEEYQADVQNRSGGRGHKGPAIFVLSAKTTDRLQQQVGNLLSYLRNNRPDTSVELEDIAYTLQTGREAFPERLAVVASDVEQLMDALAAFHDSSSLTGSAYSGSVKTASAKGSLSSGNAGKAFMEAAIKEQEWEQLARMWTLGADVDWHVLYTHHTPSTLSLPTYPFLRERYWIDEGTAKANLPHMEYTAGVGAPFNVASAVIGSGAPAAIAGEVEAEQTLHYYAPKWVLSPLSSVSSAPAVQQGQPASVLLVYPVNHGGLVRGLTDFHQDCDVRSIVLGTVNRQMDLHTWEVDISSADGLFGCMERFPAFDTVYFMGGIQPEPYALDDFGQSELLHKQGVLSLFRLVKALSKQLESQDQEIRLKVVTSNLHDILPGELNQRPFTGGLTGLARTMSKEYPRIKISNVDISMLSRDSQWSKDELALIVRELAEAPLVRDGEESALRSGRRYVRRLFPAVLPTTSADPYVTNGVYVIIGGLGTIGYEMALHLAGTVHARLAIIGRSELDAGKQQRISALKELGATVNYVKADVSQVDSLAQAFAGIKQKWGSIQGVFHSAMTYGEERLDGMSEETLQTAVAPKIAGSLALYHALKHEEPDFVVFFSSGQSFTGNAGRGHYGAGCNFQDTFAASWNREAHYDVKVINWGFWRNNDPELRDEIHQTLSQIGIYPIYPAEGLQAVKQLITSGAGQILAFKVKQFVLDLMNVDMQEKINYGSSQENDGFDRIKELAAGIVPPQDNIEDAEAAMAAINEYSLLSAFQRMGVFKHSGEYYSKTRLCGHLGVTRGYSRLFSALLNILKRGGYLEISEDVIRCTDQIAAPKTIRELEQLEARKEYLTFVYPEVKALVELAWICLNNAPALLRGDISAADFMFPNSSMELVEGVYKGNAAADYFNGLMVLAVTEVVESALPQLREGEQLKIIEVGAGTGGTSQLVLKALAKYGERISYLYTDVSGAFIQHGKTVFGPSYDFMDFKVLDVEKDVRQQGFSQGEYHLAIAANILHATVNMSATLENVRPLLKENGCIILNEATKVNDFLTVTFGMLEGWWLYEDEADRLEDSPLLSEELWANTLVSAGYSLPTALVEASSSKRGLFQNIILARRSEGLKKVEGSQKQQLPGIQATASTGGGVGSHSAQTYVSGKEVNELDVLQQAVKELISGVIQIPPDRLDSELPLVDYGVDSIFAVKIVDLINEQMGLHLKSTVLFDHPTLKKLTGYIFLEKERDIQHA
ncbi:SDR family NAD(P)-dependent oxidoreductase [Paenibacillus monticola]|uniref:SDR family NAD(P)-dependent oxidoreductase n=1 Tax=Paenibacillus monticola TaxID=2666075 RepID=A0A7X2H1J1_9BACL|nr:SDR family NAD(P)-dependent oxidoreductase [Paenibacillus monticola]MRN51867.1 SDR family NAD(P)-dependent oxidoreductase [Paenibacillus monticola]